MDQRTEPLRQDIDAIRDSMTDKMGQIEAKVKNTVDDTTETVKRAFDIKGQAAERPWAAVGLSLLAGYMLGILGGSNEGYASGTKLDPRQMPNTGPNDNYMRYVSSDPSKNTPNSSDAYSTSGSADYPQSNAYPQYNQPSYNSAAQASYGGPASYSQSSYSQPSYNQPSYSQPSYSQPSSSSQNKSSQSGLLDSLLGQFGGEIDTLKTAAVSAVIGMLRDTIQQSLPQFSQEYERALRERGSGQSSSSTTYTSGSTSYTSGANTYDTPSSSPSYATSTTDADTGNADRSVGSNNDYDYRSSGPKI